MRFLLEILLGLELARQVAADQLDRRQIAVGHCRLHLVDGGLVQLEAEAVGHGEQIVRAGILLQRDQVGRHGEHLRHVERGRTRNEGGQGELVLHGGDKMPKKKRREDDDIKKKNFKISKRKREGEEVEEGEVRGMKEVSETASDCPGY